MRALLPLRDSARVGRTRPVRWAWSLLPAVLLGLITFPFVYQDCAPEHDTTLMVCGAFESVAKGQPWSGTHLYGMSFSYGYYWLLFQLPKSVLGDPARLLTAVNWMGYASSVLACAALGLLTRRLHGVWLGLAITLPVALSPMVLRAATYGHPMMLSAALFFLGGLALIEAESRGRAARLGESVLAGLLLVASAAIRSDSLLAFPWLAAIAPAHGANRGPRTLGVRAVVLGGAVAAILALQHKIVPEPGGGLSLVSKYLDIFYRPRLIPKGLAVFALGSGIATLGSAVAFQGWTWVHRVFDRRAVPAYLMLAIAMLFWVPVPTPSRHLFYGLLAFSEILAVAAARTLGPKRAVILAAALVIANQVVAEALYAPVVRGYRWADGAPTSRRLATGAVPIGWFLPDHIAHQMDSRALRTEGQRLARSPAREIAVFGDAWSAIILGQLERGDVLAWVDTVEVGFPATRIERPAQTIHLLPRAGGESCAAYLAANAFPDARIYLQSVSRKSGEWERVPAGRALEPFDPSN